MKITVAKPDLDAALQVAAIGAASNGTDLTTHFVFRHRDDGVTEILSNNNRLGCSMPIAGAQVEASGSDKSFTVESWRLRKWISAVEDAELVLEHSDGSVRATSPKGSVKFQSLDPEQFPYWDETFSGTEGGTAINAKRLCSALSHVKMFISDKDTTTPKLAVTEVLNESLQATDKGALAVVTLDELKTSNLRVHGKDLSQVISFLSSCGDADVEIREHERCLFLVRPNGGTLSVGRPHHAFPDIQLDKKPDDPHWWSLSTEDLHSAIGALVASASKEDTRLNFDIKDGVVALSMNAASGDKVTLHLGAIEHGSSSDAKNEMPEGGFDVAYPYLLKLIGHYQSGIMKFGLNPQVDKSGKPKGGWVRFREDRDGDDYLTLLVWML